MVPPPARFFGALALFATSLTVPNLGYGQVLFRDLQYGASNGDLGPERGLYDRLNDVGATARCVRRHALCKAA